MRTRTTSRRLFHRPLTARATAISAACFAAIPALGQAIDEPVPQASEAPVIEPLEKDWTIRIEPFVGYIGPAGDLRLPSSTTRGSEVELDDLNLDSPRLMPVGRIRVERGKWGFILTGLGFSADDRGAAQTDGGQIGAVPFAAGDRLVSDLSYESFDLLASYRVFSHISETTDSGRVRLDAGVDFIGGLRFHHADFDIRNQPASLPAPGTPLAASADEFFAEPVIGARLDIEFSERFGIEVESVGGGFTTGDRSSVSFSIDAGFSYRPIPSVGVKLGYRMMVFNLNDGDGADEFEWSGSMAGLYFGAQISF